MERENFTFEFRSAKGQAALLPSLARELVHLNVNVIVTGSDAAIRAARDATNRIPIVMAGSVLDPVATGLIQSFNRPGGNLTGAFVRLDELNGKRLELLKEMLPTISVVAVLSDKLGRNQLTALTHAAGALGVKLEPIDVSDSYDFDAEFTRAKAKHAGAVILLGSPAFYVHRARIGSTAAKGGLAVVSPYQEITERGGLMSYAADNSDVYFRAASIVDRVLNGANPGDLPIDQVARLRLVVNLKTAKSLRITIPESILVRADEIIR